MRSPWLWLLLAIVVAARPAAAALPTFDPAAVYAVPTGDGPARGPVDAPVTLVLWSAFDCQYCAHLVGTLEQLERVYPQQLRLVFRHLPLDPDAPLAAEASLAAAAQGVFWPMHDRLFAVRGKVDRAEIETIAAELGLDRVALRGDLDAGTHRAQIAADVAAAEALGVTGTPTLFVNGRPIRGAQGVATYARVIDEELARATAEPKADYAARVAVGRPRADADPDALDVPDDSLDERARYLAGLGLPGHSEGPDDALVTIVEFADLACGYCRRQAPLLLRLRAEFPDDVRLVRRHFPLDSHPEAWVAAEAAVEAAAQGKLAPFLAALLARAHVVRDDLDAAAATAGLDPARFAAALADRRHREVVLADVAAGGALGVDGTPTIFLNGAPVGGAMPWDALRSLVQVHLDQARAALAMGVVRSEIYGLLAGEAIRRDLADPSRLPTVGAVAVELGAVDRDRAIAAACRRRDAGGAAALAKRLRGAAKDRAASLCAGLGVDLP